MHFSQRTSKALSLAVAALLVGALLYFGFRAPSLHSVNAAPQQTQPATRSVSAAVRDSYADVVDRVAPAVVTIPLGETRSGAPAVSLL